MKRGFTLAEVLITLSIIGVVAALTMPSLIQNHQKKQTAVKLKQTYSLMIQGIRLAENELGEIENWEVSESKTFSDTYIKPYFKVVQEYEPSEMPPDYHIYCHNGDICEGYGAFLPAKKLVLANGVLITPHPYSYNISGQTYTSFTIIVDVNGLNGPNRYGRDIFMFNIDIQYGLIPYGLGNIAGQIDKKDVSRNTLMSGESRACKILGIYCAAVIMLDGWEIKDDYPW